MLAAACGSDADRAGTDREVIPTATTAVPTSTVPDPSEAEYRELFNAVSRVATETTRVLNQLAIVATRDDAARRAFQTDVEVTIGSFDLLMQQLAAAEPVPERLKPAHDSVKSAVSQYITAAQLLLPPESGGADPFTFNEFQMTMQSAGADFHGAGALLP